MVSRVIWAVVVVGLMVRGAGAADDPVYPVRMIRPSHVGQRVRDERVYAEVVTTTMTWDGAARGQPQEESVGATLRGRIEVKAVDRFGEATELVYDVDRFTRTEGGADVEVLAAGRRVGMKLGADGKTQYTLDGAAAPKDVSDLLGRMLYLVRGRAGQDVDRECGTSAGLRVGQEVPIDVPAVLDYYKAQGFETAGAEMQGTTKLERVEPRDGVECLVVTVDSRTTGLVPPYLTKLPAGAKLEEVGRDLRRTSWLPVDVGRPSMGSQTSETRRIVTHASDRGKGYRLERTTRRETRVRHWDEQRPTTTQAAESTDRRPRGRGAENRE